MEKRFFRIKYRGQKRAAYLDLNNYDMSLERFREQIYEKAAVKPGDFGHVKMEWEMEYGSYVKLSGDDDFRVFVQWMAANKYRKVMVIRIIKDENCPSCCCVM